MITIKITLNIYIQFWQVIDEIAGLTGLERSFIERDVFQSRYGEIGGMYNIR